MDNSKTETVKAPAAPATNNLSLSRSDYLGAKSTLCSGCGHDSITNTLITALYQSSVNPYKVAKMSGIGCSSKTTAYFLDKSHGFNSLHGRMAPVATGSKAANKDLSVLGISGDGDTASIGLGGFSHLVRRNVPMVYIIENNGVYGLTKGQFSATADFGSVQKSGLVNEFQSIDLCALAIELGCGFVARSFSGDSKQLVPLLRSALQHPGTAVIDIVSPCITFANNPGSTRSYDAVKELNVPLQELGYIVPTPEIKVDYAEGETTVVPMHDGSLLTLKKIDSRAHDVSNAKEALSVLFDSRQNNHFLTGLFYYNNSKQNHVEAMNTVETPLAHLTEADLRPSATQLKDCLLEFY
jgi:2-oxoglutarate/2-oxoacid ferredoxin oxidoreductase subunit beta